jgi:alkylated DNA repair dioxygenase AlkB
MTTSIASSWQLAEVVDLDRYPIDRPDSDEYRALVAEARRELADDGAFVLDGFVRSEAIGRIVPAVDAIEEHAFHATKNHNVYLRADDPALSPDHPRNAKQVTTSATVGYDHTSTIGDLDGLYRSGAMRRFAADALGHDELFVYEDSLAPVSVLFYRPGTRLGWHFDNSTFTVTLMLREADVGAAFEYVPFVLEGDDLAFDRVASIVDGDRAEVRTLQQSGGTLVLFQGSRTMHRVTEVTGPTTRLLATLSYSPLPGARLSAVNQQTFYGRAIDGAAEPSA